jgi:hypothetical protein
MPHRRQDFAPVCVSHPWGQSFQFLRFYHQSCWYQRSAQRHSSSLGQRDPSSFVRRIPGVATGNQPKPFISQSGDRLTIFSFLVRFSEGKTDRPASHKFGVAHFHKRVVYSFCVPRQSLVRWPDAGHGLLPASSGSQCHPAYGTCALAPIQALCEKGNLRCNSKTLEPGMGPVRHRQNH